ncbi:MAG: hypothetical protein ACR2GL_06185 [Thermoleophilaceae bacterium]
MELRRALLLFAIVLGLAAIATSLSGPSEGGEDAAPIPPVQQAPPATERTGETELVTIPFSTRGDRRTALLAAGRAAVVTVEVTRPGEVELRGLGLSAPAEPLTAARFEFFGRRTGTYDVRFTPVAGEPRTIGKLRVLGAG